MAKTVIGLKILSKEEDEDTNDEVFICGFELDGKPKGTLMLRDKTHRKFVEVLCAACTHNVDPEEDISVQDDLTFEYDHDY